MTEPRARYDVTFERDDDGLPTRLFYSPSTPVYPDVAIQSNEPAAAPRDEGIRELVDDVLEVLLTNLTRRMRLEGTTTDTEILAAWQPYEVSIRARLERMLAPRDSSLTAYVDDLLDLLQEVGGMSAEWCETKLHEYEKLLREG